MWGAIYCIVTRQILKFEFTYNSKTIYIYFYLFVAQYFIKDGKKPKRFTILA